MGILNTIPRESIYGIASIVPAYEADTRSKVLAMMVIRLGKSVVRRLGMYVQSRSIPGRLSDITIGADGRSAGGTQGNLVEKYNWFQKYEHTDERRLTRF